MRSSLILVTVLASAISASACGGGGSSNQTPTSPGTTTPSIVTVSIVGTKGNASYVPDPVQKASGDQVMFKNNDPLLTHHIVMDDNSADFGSLSPGTSSQAKAVTTGNFHCANHPSMVGSIGGTEAPIPAPGSGDGY